MIQSRSSDIQLPNFDTGSRSSAYFMNEDEMADYEEKMQAKVQEKWAEIEKKLEQYQNLTLQQLMDLRNKKNKQFIESF